MSADVFISKTLETNQRFLKNGKSKTEFTDTVTNVIQICLSEHSKEKVQELKKVMPRLEQIVLKDSPICGYTLYILADCCKKLNLFGESLQYGNESLQIREILYGVDSNEVCICLDLLASTALESGEYNNSINLFIKSFQRKALGGFTTYNQLVVDVNKFALVIGDKAPRHQKVSLITQVFAMAVDVLVKLLQSSDATKDADRLYDLKKTIVTLCNEKGRVHVEQQDFQQSAECYKIILNCLNNGSKEERISYEQIIISFVRMNKYDEIKNYIGQFIQMATKYYKVPSVDAATVLWFCARVLEEQSDKASPTRLCDLVDSLRYYICTLKISREVGGVTLDEESPGLAQKKVREKIETILFNNRPIKPEDAANMVERMLQVTTTDFLLNTTKSQNWLLKYLYPDFIVEDALKEKADSLPAKSGFLSLNGLLKSWKTRWFTLERDTLSYYKYNNDPKPQGEINILETKSIEILPKEKRIKPQLHCFQISHPKHTILLAAESEEVMKEWVNVLNEAKLYWEDSDIHV